MQQHVASFSLLKINRSFLINVRKLQGDDDAKLFLFDTGASISLLGINSFVGEDMRAGDILKDILETEIRTKQITPYRETLKSITNEPVTAYPCKCDEVLISGINPITFYFHIYLGNVSMPVLGFDYIDDCSFVHSISGGVDITAVASDPGKRFYPDNLIDFNFVMKEYYSRIER